jgi:FMN reductase
MTPLETRQPLIVGIGGGVSASSSTDQALALALNEAARHGARTVLLGSQQLSQLPLYMSAGCMVEGKALVETIRSADGVVIASPGYHGSVSGMVKNAIDYIEETSKDSRPYLTDLPVGLITVAGGHQAAVNTLSALRTIVHALRGWPTPFGAAIKLSAGLFCSGVCTDETTSRQLELVGRQVYDFAMQATLITSVDQIAVDPDRAWTKGTYDEIFEVDLSSWR